jgi:hypothetical protein
MAEKNTPSRSVDTKKVEGQRWRSEPDTVENMTRDNSDRQYQSDEGRGPSNRPVGEEIENQDVLPERGMSQTDERRRSRPHAEEQRIDEVRGLGVEDVER